MKEPQQRHPDMTWGQALKATAKSAPVILLALAVWHVVYARRMHAFVGVEEFVLMTTVVAVVWHHSLKVFLPTLVAVMLVIVAALPILDAWYPARLTRPGGPVQAGGK